MKMNNEYTSQWFRDKLFETALSLYKEHWHRYGKYDSHRPDDFVTSRDFRDSILDSDIVHEEQDNGKSFEALKSEFYAYIDSGELGTYIHNQMIDYAGDLEEERILHRRRYAGNLKPI